MQPIEKINDGITSELKFFDAYREFMIDKKIAQPCSTLDELTAAARSALEKAKGKDAETLKGWATNARHLQAQRMGRAKWYAYYKIEVAEVVRDSRFTREPA